jgi:hypothetical protein
MTTPGRGRRLTLSVRGFMLLVLALGLWLGLRVNQARRQRIAVEAILAAGGHVLYDWQQAQREAPPGPEWLRRLIGDEFFRTAAEVNLSSGHVPVTPDVIEHVQVLPGLELLVLPKELATDSSMAAISGLTDLEALYIDGPARITDAGVAHLANLDKLAVLRIEGASLTETGFAAVAEHRGLYILDLTGSTITDAGLGHVAKLKKLNGLHLSGSNLTDKGLTQLLALTDLECLTVLTGSGGPTPEGIAKLKASMPKLKGEN